MDLQCKHASFPRMAGSSKTPVCTTPCFTLTLSSPRSGHAAVLRFAKVSTMAACTIMFKTDIQCTVYKTCMKDLPGVCTSPVHASTDERNVVERGHLTILFILFWALCGHGTANSSCFVCEFAIRRYTPDVCVCVCVCVRARVHVCPCVCVCACVPYGK